VPLVNDGRQRVQPVFAGDIASAILETLKLPAQSSTFHLGGPQEMSLKELVHFVQVRSTTQYCVVFVFVFVLLFCSCRPLSTWAARKRCRSKSWFTLCRYVVQL
jgi:hypothetical protein